MYVGAVILTSDDRCQRQVVEKVGELCPHICAAILAHHLIAGRGSSGRGGMQGRHLIVETIHLCDLPAFVVSTQNGDSIRISHLQHPIVMEVRELRASGWWWAHLEKH